MEFGQVSRMPGISRIGSSLPAGNTTTRSNGGTTNAISRSSIILQGRIQFVQVGETGHHHPPNGRRVIDLRGKTDLRVSLCGSFTIPRVFFVP